MFISGHIVCLHRQCVRESHEYRKFEQEAGIDL